MGRYYYVTGGEHRRNAKGEEEWINFRRARLFLIDLETGSVVNAVEYESPPDHRPDDPRCNIVFKAGTIDGDRLHVCTQTEILTYSLPDLRVERCLSHPWFNDLHHVTVNEAGHFLVAVTGLDLVMEITKDGEVVQDWPVLDNNTWQRFDRETDYRKVATTKPHLSHPNYVFEHEGGLWATRFVQKDAIRLVGGPGQIEAQDELLHDGHVVGDRAYFTSVDGKLIVADLTTGKTLRIHDFTAMTDTRQILGWCRGLQLLEGNRVLVGFSRIRPSKIRENLRWVKYNLLLGDTVSRLGTRLARYDLGTETLEWTMDLESHGMNAVFSILPVETAK